MYNTENKLEISKSLKPILDSEGITYSENSHSLIPVIENKDQEVQEAFEIGWTCGTRYEKKKHDKPEEFWLPTKYAKLLDQAIKDHCKKSFLSNTSIKIDLEADGDSKKITVSPTAIHFLFNCFSEYGKLVEKQNQTNWLRRWE